MNERERKKGGGARAYLRRAVMVQHTQPYRHNMRGWRAYLAALPAPCYRRSAAIIPRLSAPPSSKARRSSSLISSYCGGPRRCPDAYAPAVGRFPRGTRCFHANLTGWSIMRRPAFRGDGAAPTECEGAKRTLREAAPWVRLLLEATEVCADAMAVSAGGSSSPNARTYWFRLSLRALWHGAPDGVVRTAIPR